MLSPTGIIRLTHDLAFRLILQGMEILSKTMLDIAYVIGD